MASMAIYKLYPLLEREDFQVYESLLSTRVKRIEAFPGLALTALAVGSLIVFIILKSANNRWRNGRIRPD